MKIVFVSNFMNHHQLPLSNELQKQKDIDYCFVATEEVPQERRIMGYYDMNYQYPFVLCAYESEEKKEIALKLCLEADVVIYGSAPAIYIKERLKENKLTFKYSERIYKKEPELWTMPLRFVKNFFENTRHKNLYMLCSSAYTAYDYSRTKNYIGKTFKWGYFPEIYTYENMELLINAKNVNSILWAGRLIDWKHPEIVIEVGQRLKESGIMFEINIIGTGIMEQQLKERVVKEQLDSCIHFLGVMSPEDVRTHMINSQIYLFTSDRKEGWGAVLNEAMNSGCAIIANNEIGAVPFLLNDGENGLIYKSDDIEEIYRKVEYLLNNPAKQKKMGLEAYKTVKEVWNAKIAAERLIKLSEKLQERVGDIELYEEGPCSIARIIRG